MIEITKLQATWLSTRGGSTIRDVVKVNNKLYIGMWYYGRYKRYEIPSDEDIHKEFTVTVSNSNFRKLRLVEKDR